MEVIVLQHKIIQESINKCIIDIPDYDIYNHLIHDINIQESFRATEMGDARFSESENIRIEV